MRSKRERLALIRKWHAEEVQILKRLGTIRLLMYYAGALTWCEAKVGLGPNEKLLKPKRTTCK